MVRLETPCRRSSPKINFFVSHKLRKTKSEDFGFGMVGWSRSSKFSYQAVPEEKLRDPQYHSRMEAAEASHAAKEKVAPGKLGEEVDQEN